MLLRGLFSIHPGMKPGHEIAPHPCNRLNSAVNPANGSDDRVRMDFRYTTELTLQWTGLRAVVYAGMGVVGQEYFLHSD